MAAKARASPAVWEKPISISATAATATVPAWSSIRDGSGMPNDGQAARDVADEGDAAGAEVEQVRREQPADDEDERARDPGRDRLEPEHHDERDDADDERRGGAMSPSVPSHETQLLERVGPGDVGAGDLGQLTDDDVDRGAEQEAGHHGPGEELGDPAHLAARRGAGTADPEARVMPRDERGDVAWSVSPAATTALAATAARPELGPIEICRQVPKIA